MKVTTDYQRQRRVKTPAADASTCACRCREIAEHLLVHGVWNFTAEDAIRMRNQQIGAKTPACMHEALFAIILIMDKAHLLAALFEHNIKLINLDQHQRSILHLAVTRQAVNCTRELLQCTKASTTQWILRKDKHGVTPLHLAARLDCTKILRLFLNELSSAGCDIFAEVRDKSARSPLHYAAAAGALGACELLIAGDWCPLDQRDNYAQTPLMYAVGCGSHASEVVSLLARKKIISITTRNKRGMTALHLAVLADNIKALKIFFSEPQIGPTVFDNVQRTPLHYAALFGRTEAAGLLLAAGATNEIRDQHNVTAAHYAAQANHFCTFRTILKTASDVVDNENRTCFMWAVIAQSEETVSAMLRDAGFYVDRAHRDRYKYSALHLAALGGNKNICRMLVDALFDIRDRDTFEATPEHLAASEGHLDALTIFAFQRGGVQLPELDVKRRSPFFYACLAGQAHAVRRMLEEQRSNIDSRHVDREGFTALHCAVLAGSLQCVELLVKNNFNVFAEDNEKRTPAKLAREIGKNDIADYLITVVMNSAPVGAASFSIVTASSLSSSPTPKTITHDEKF